MRTMAGVVVALVAVVVIGATVLGLPASSEAAVAAPPQTTTTPVRPPLQHHVVAARDAVTATRVARADRAAARVEAARLDAQARWDLGDVPLTPPRLALALGLAVAMLVAAVRRQER